jgi:hypothetical protein
VIAGVDSGLDDPRAKLRRVDERRMAYLRLQFGRFCARGDDAEARALLAYSLFVGSYFFSAGHGRRTRAEVRQLAIDRLLAS